MIQVTVGVLAYNEEQNIEHALRSVLAQRLHSCRISEVVVIASGCTDRTAAVAQAMGDEHAAVTCIVEPHRAGKAAAIHRLRDMAIGDIIVLVGADTVLHPDALERLVQPFADPRVGMTGARAVPLNDRGTKIGFAVHMLWQMHDRLAIRHPKLGELVAFRNLPGHLPADTITDEVALEAFITECGYELFYAAEAVVYNRGPETVKEFVSQRRRIYAGHLQIAFRLGYVASSMPLKHLAPLARYAFSGPLRTIPAVVYACVLEGTARLLGGVDFWCGRSHAVWQTLPSTKLLSRPEQPVGWWTSPEWAERRELPLQFQLYEKTLAFELRRDRVPGGILDLPGVRDQR